MSVAKCSSFLAVLRDSQLLQPEQLEELRRNPVAQAGDLNALARLPLQRGWLTRFQIQMLVQGRSKALTLGPYRLLDRLGEGGMGQVFKAHHEFMNRIVALKVIRKEKLANPDAARRFCQEVQAAAQLIHPNIVIAYDAGRVDATHYFAMEYIEGIDLARLVRESGPLPVAQACDYVRQAALGLQHAHERNMVHRDIKPANLLVTREKTNESAAKQDVRAVVKVLDMGLARLHGMAEGSHALTKDGAVVGTPDFLAPEQALNAHTVDIRADIYSLGCTLYFLLAGQPPFQGGSLTELLLKHQIEEPKPVEAHRPDVPPAVRTIVRKMMAKRADDRYAQPAEVAEALEAFARGDDHDAEVLGRIAAKKGSSADTDWASLADSQEASDSTATPFASDDAAVVPAKKRQAAWNEKKRTLILAGVGGGLALATLLVLLLFTGNDASPKKLIAKNEPEKVRAAIVEELKSVPPPKSIKRLDSVKRLEPEPMPIAVVRQPSLAAIPIPPQPDAAADVKVKRVRVLQGHTGQVLNVAFAPDGRRAYSADQLEVRSWDLTDGRELSRQAFPGRLVRSLAIASDGRRALASGIKYLWLWNLETGQVIRNFDGLGDYVEPVAFTPDGKRVLCASYRNELIDNSNQSADFFIRLMDLASGKEVARMLGHTREIAGLAVAPDGRRALSSSKDASIRLWNLETGRQLVIWNNEQKLPVGPVEFCPNGRNFVFVVSEKWCVGDTDNVSAVKVYDGHSKGINAIATSSDGRRLLTSGNDRTVRLWEIETGKELARMAGHTDTITCVAFSPKGNLALTGSWDQTVHVWELEE